VVELSPAGVATSSRSNEDAEGTRLLAVHRGSYGWPRIANDNKEASICSTQFGSRGLTRHADEMICADPDLPRTCDKGEGQRMSTFLITWNPDNWLWPQDEFDAAVEATAAGRPYPDRWSVGIRKSGINAGDRAFLVRQKRDRGIVGSAVFTSPIFEHPHWDNSGRLTTYADLEFDVLLPIEDRFEIEEVRRSVPGVVWDRLQGSGVRVDGLAADLLEHAWCAHVGSSPYRSPDEFPPGIYEEGALTKILVNKYERDRRARAACIAHHGTVCAVCQFDFQSRYGRLGRDFVHVHHVRELSTLGPGYNVDPQSDLVPLCANCHSMVHRRRPALTPSELRRRLQP
jgi:5-methylcytosine-specific restriction enzyme A